MNKNYRVITINGVRGIIVAIFIVLGLIAGFVISPGWVCMKIWNHAFQNSSGVAIMNIFQGIMLWVIIALSLYALNNKKMLVGFGSYQGLSPEQIKDIMKKSGESDYERMKLIEKIKNEVSNLNKDINNPENIKVEDASLKQEVRLEEDKTEKVGK